MTHDPKLVAAVIAAVEAFLDAELVEQAGTRTVCIGAWRMAGRRPAERSPFGRGLAWRYTN